MSEAKVSLRQWEEATRWLRRVDADLAAADVLLDTKPPLNDVAAFHCQQAAEKIGKAALVAFGLEPPHIHSIGQLSALLRLHVPVLAAALEKLGGLTVWYIVGRYPDSEAQISPTIEEIHSALAEIKELRQKVDSLAPRKDGGQERTD